MERIDENNVTEGPPGFSSEGQGIVWASTKRQ